MDGSNIVKVTLLATSDVHGFYQPWDYSKDEPVKKGGLSRVSTIYKKIKEENPNTMIIDCGDLIQGNNAETFIDREISPGVIALNHIGYEIYNMGNHEFNFGMERLMKVVRQFKGISMMGNLYDKDGYRVMNSFYIRHFGNIKVGFISLNTPLVRHFEAKRGNLDDYIVTDADEELSRILHEIEDEDLDALVGVFHMGDNNENNIPNTGVRDLIYKVDGSQRIDAIFGGHMHRVIDKLNLRNTVYVQPGSRGEVVNRIDLTFDTSKDKKLIKVEASAIEVDETIESDLELEALLKPYHDELRDFANEYVAFVKGEALTPKDEIKGIPQTRVGESEVSDFFLEVMLHFSKADVVASHFDNSYPIMPKGRIKRKHIYNSYSYSGGDISKYQITGRDLKDYMEWSAGYFNQSKQGDIYVSFDRERQKFKYSTFDIFGNISYCLDITKPMGSRVRDLYYLDGRPIKDTDTLTIGLNKYRMDFLTSDEGPLHDREFPLLWSSMTDKSLGVRGSIRSLAIKYLRELPSGIYWPKKLTRWRIRTYPMNFVVRDKAIEMINEGVIFLPKNSDGSIDHCVSKNIYETLSKEEYLNIKDNFSRTIKQVDEGMSIIDLIYYNS